MERQNLSMRETTRTEVSTMGDVLEEFATRFVAILDFTLGVPAPANDATHFRRSLEGSG